MTANQRVPAEARGYDSSLGFLTVEKDGKLEVLPLKIDLTPTHNAFHSIQLGARALEGEGPVLADAREARNVID